MTKKELLSKKQELETELKDVNREIATIDLKKIKDKYKEKALCEYCRYSAVIDCGSDRNICAKEGCACFHTCCENYKPDNDASTLIKVLLRRSPSISGTGCIDLDESNALRAIGADIFADYPTAYTMSVLRALITHKGARNPFESDIKFSGDMKYAT